MKSFKYSAPGTLSITLVSFFKDHVGVENAVTKNAVFKKIRGVKFDNQNIKHVNAWGSIKAAMHKLRKTSLCFIQSTRPQGGYEPSKYFVVKRFNESSKFAKDMTLQTKTRIENIKRAQESVYDKDFRKEWFE